MTGYLVDTSVLSMLALNRPDATPEFLDWVRERDRELHVSTVSVAEIEQGIEKLRRLGGTRKPDSLAMWLKGTLDDYSERVLDFDVAAATTAGRLADQALASGFQPGTADLYIAATAQTYGLVILTRNLKHFLPLEVVAIDPLAGLPD